MMHIMGIGETSGWAVELGFTETVTVVRGLSPREACRRWGATKAPAVRRRYDVVSDLQVADRRLWIVAWEVEGATGCGSRPVSRVSGRRSWRR
jgi:hypothetical protein